MKLKHEWVSAMEKRVSRRTFNKKPLAEADVQDIQMLLKAFNEVSKLNMRLVLNGNHSLKGFKASYGIISGTDTFIALIADKSVEDYEVKAGYYGELAMLECVSRKLGTCWVGGTYDKKKCQKNLELKESEVLVAIIAVGHVLEKKSIKEKVFKMFVNKKSKSFNDILIEQRPTPPLWVSHGINAVMSAPSALHKQPVSYSYIDGVLSATTSMKNHGFEHVDLGISLAHFELGAFSYGIFGSFEKDGDQYIFKRS